MHINADVTMKVKQEETTTNNQNNALHSKTHALIWFIVNTFVCSQLLHKQ